ncbi:MAG: putative toxin-antitoxin system toxin component, PIN family [Candidatus Methanoperedens sp.]|nr:putative toxin-antitoxin system toxin component, PIN family [Candidatus Methanoperedens sp.]MCZ7405322.1 putative toxin-antitoxin system toxin component, PIN family [Candidatus Methanoperedens sp.]
MLRIVADTNIYISALFWRGNPNRLIHLCYAGKAKLVVSMKIIEELERILLADEKFLMARAYVALNTEIILSNAELVEPNVTLNVIKEDPADDRILECAIEGKAEYLVSGNKHLLNLKEFQGIKILTARQMVEILEPSQPF